MKKKFEAPQSWERSRILLGLLIIFTVFESAARGLGSDRGQAGLIVCAIVIATCLGVESVLFGRSAVHAWRVLGLGLPAARGWMIAFGAVTVLLLILFVVDQADSITIELTADALVLLPGLFAQGGIGEEILFRGYLYRHFRTRRSYRHAATLSMLPFAAVHLLLFLSLPWQIALLGWLVSVVLSYPLAHLFEISGNSIWPPALVHFVIQAVPKVTTISNAPDWVLPISWMMLTVAVLWLVMALDQVLRRKSKVITSLESPLPRSCGPDDCDAEGRPYVLAKH